MSDLRHLGHALSASLVLLTVVAVLFYKYVDSYLLRWQFQKTSKNIRKIKRFETIITAIFTNPNKTFDMKGTNQFTVHLLHKIRFRFAELTFNLCDSDIRKDCFGNQYIRLFYMITDKKKMPFITRLRATHLSPTDTIFFEGIEVWELTSNRRIYYSVRETIRGGVNIKDTDRLYTKPQRVSLWSKQTFCVSFENPSIYEFGEELMPRSDRQRTESLYGEDVNGVLIPSRLDWYESVLFYALLFCLTFLFDISFLIFNFENISQKESDFRFVLTVFFSGLLALIITEVFASIFFHYIKHYYEKSRSPSAQSDRLKNGTTNFWPMIRVIYLGGITFTAVVAIISVIIALMIAEKNESVVQKYKQFVIIGSHWADETILFCSAFMVSLALIAIWVLVLGFIRHLFRCLTFTTKTLSTTDKSVPDSSDTSDDTVFIKSVIPVKSKQKRESLSKTSNESVNKLSSKESAPVKKNAIPGTEQLEKEMADEKRKQRLLTKSVIHPSTKSKGFISPEEFRASESKV